MEVYDDLDGSRLVGDRHDLTFGLEGRRYEMRLSEANASTPREVFAPYIERARRLRLPTPSVGEHGSGQDVPGSVVRAWAVSQAIPVAARGRIEAQRMQRYPNAH